jgi:hypothetical protein
MQDFFRARWRSLVSREIRIGNTRGIIQATGSITYQLQAVGTLKLFRGFQANVSRENADQFN